MSFWKLYYEKAKNLNNSELSPIFDVKQKNLNGTQMGAMIFQWNSNSNLTGENERDEIIIKLPQMIK